MRRWVSSVSSICHLQSSIQGSWHAGLHSFGRGDCKARVQASTVSAQLRMLSHLSLATFITRSPSVHLGGPGIERACLPDVVACLPWLYDRPVVMRLSLMMICCSGRCARRPKSIRVLPPPHSSFRAPEALCSPSSASFARWTRALDCLPRLLLDRLLGRSML